MRLAKNTQGYAVSAAAGADVNVSDSAFEENHATASLSATDAGTKLTVTDVLVEHTIESDIFVDGDGLDAAAQATVELEAGAFMHEALVGITANAGGPVIHGHGLMFEGAPKPDNLGTYGAAFADGDVSLDISNSVMAKSTAAIQFN